MEKRLAYASGETGPQDELPVKSTTLKTKRFGHVSERPKLAETLEKFQKVLPTIYNREKK